MKLRSGRIISEPSQAVIPLLCKRVVSKKVLSLPHKRSLDLSGIVNHRDSKCLRTRIVKIARDGNCFFECIRRRLPDRVSVSKLRHRFASWLEKNLEYIEDSLDFSVIRRDGYFNNDETDYAVSLAHQILGVDVVIHTEDGGVVFNGDIVRKSPEIRENTIVLYRHNNLHFDLIIENEQKVLF